MTATTYNPRPLSLIPGHRDNPKSRTRWCPQDGREYPATTLQSEGAAVATPWCTKCGKHGDALPLEGMFLATSWGYDQTNVEFYRVMGRTKSGKSVRLQRWTAKAAPDQDGGPSADYLIPGDGPATEPVYGPSYADADGWLHRGEVTGYTDMPVFTHRARFHVGALDMSTTVLGHYAHLFDGRPVYATAAGWGH